MFQIRGLAAAGVYFIETGSGGRPSSGIRDDGGDNVGRWPTMNRV